MDNHVSTAMDAEAERKKARLAESRVRIDALVKEHEDRSAERLSDVMDVAMEDAETTSVAEFRKRLREAD